MGWCCAVNCTSCSTKGKKLFKFPWDPVRRELWQKAVNRFDADLKPWRPTFSSLICEDHFVTGKPSKDSRHVDYVPTLFNLRSVSNKKSKKLSSYVKSNTDIKVEVMNLELSAAEALVRLQENNRCPVFSSLGNETKSKEDSVELKMENIKLKHENQKLKIEIQDLKLEIAKLRGDC